MLNQRSGDHRLVCPHKGQQQDEHSGPTWRGGVVLRLANVGHPTDCLLMSSYTTACGSDRQARRSPALSCFERQDTPCLWCLFACQDAPSHYIPFSQRHVQERLRHRPCECPVLPHPNLRLPHRANITTLLISFHTLCPLCSSVSASLQSSGPAPGLRKPCVQAPVRQLAEPRAHVVISLGCLFT